MQNKVATPAQVIQMVMQEAKSRGLSWFQPHHAAGMVGSFMQETGDFREDVLNFSLKGDKGTAYGLMQWRGDRWRNLQKFASQKGMQLNDIRTQVAFAFEEGDPSSKFSDFGSVRSFKEFQSAKNSQETALAFVHAERSAGYDGNPSNAHDAGLRINHAQRALNDYGSGGSLATYTPPSSVGAVGSQSNQVTQSGGKLFSQQLVERLQGAGFKTAAVPDFRIFKSRNQVTQPVTQPVIQTPVPATTNPHISGHHSGHPSSVQNGNPPSDAHNHTAHNHPMGNQATDYIRYANQNATRNDPLSQKLVSALNFLGEMGVTAEVFSGGQENNTTHGLGSTRHNHGNAADVFFYKDGRKLNYNNPNDLPIYEEIVRRGKAAGLTGFGAGDGYMRPGSMHIGFGTAAVWGAGGSGENAPQWLKNAYNGAASPSTPQSNGFVEEVSPQQTTSGQFGFDPMKDFGIGNPMQVGEQPDFGLPENPILGLTNTFDQAPRPRNDLTFGSSFGTTVQ